jgi:membrane associated rhomboid family serine protease
VVEHRIARLVQLGIRQARYIGRTKTLFQLLMAAAVANLTLLAHTGTATGAPMVVSVAVFALLAALLALRSHPHTPQRTSPNLPSSGPRPALAAVLPAPLGHITFKMATSRPGF